MVSLNVLRVRGGREEGVWGAEMRAMLNVGFVFIDEDKDLFALSSSSP